MSENKSKETGKKNCTESNGQKQMELPFTGDKDLPCIISPQAKIVDITIINEKKKLDLINQIIQNSPSF